MIEQPVIVHKFDHNNTILRIKNDAIGGFKYICHNLGCRYLVIESALITPEALRIIANDIETLSATKT